MSLVVTNMPENPASLARWLDEQLVGDRLGELVAELAGVQTPTLESGSLRDVLGDALSGVLDRGLDAAEPAAVRGLLRQPRLLLELQERVFLEGGTYWQKLPRSAELAARSAEVWARIEATASAQVSPAMARSLRHSSPQWLRWNASLVAVAAVLLAVFGGWQLWHSTPRETNTIAWGWASGLPEETDPTRYLDRLAAQAEQWSDARPTTAAALVKRLGEYRQGCGVLLTATHPQLNEAQRRDLWESCRTWSGTIDELIVRVQQGEDVETVRDETDVLVAKLASALRGRISNLGV